MNIAIIGSRRGADLTDVTAFVTSLHRKHPEAVVVSGGAQGVDTTAEQCWLGLGGLVVSFRPKQVGPDEFVIERWMLVGLRVAPAQQLNSPGRDGCDASADVLPGRSVIDDPSPRLRGNFSSSRIDILDTPTWADYGSACIYRDLLIAETADRLVSFQRKGGSSGSTITVGFAREKGRAVYGYDTERRFAGVAV